MLHTGTPDYLLIYDTAESVEHQLLNSLRALIAETVEGHRTTDSDQLAGNSTMDVPLLTAPASVTSKEIENGAAHIVQRECMIFNVFRSIVLIIP